MIHLNIAFFGAAREQGQNVLNSVARALLDKIGVVVERLGGVDQLILV